MVRQTMGGPPRELSPLQLAVLQHAAAGHDMGKTAALLGKDYDNVRRARAIARVKMGAKSIAGAVREAQAQGYEMMIGSDLRPDPHGWVRLWSRGPEFVEHLDGIAWGDVPMPPEAHHCTAQTRGVVSVRGLRPMPFVRCACGAFRYADDWEFRNTRAALDGTDSRPHRVHAHRPIREED